MTEPRRPGPPTSGEVGWYECRCVPGMYYTRERILRWHGSGFYSYEDGTLQAQFVIPLHDYPLVPGDEVRKREREAFEAGREEIGLDGQGYIPTMRPHLWSTFEDYERECDA